jgi:predicted nucleic acid-binding protein
VKALYVETSAVVAWLFGEPQASAVRESIDAAGTVVTSRLTWSEVERVMARGLVTRTLKEADALRLRGLIARHRAAWIEMAVTDPVLDRLGRPFPVEPVRTLDGIHLATALEFTRAFPELGILTLDRRIADNAVALGIRA